MSFLIPVPRKNLSVVQMPLSVQSRFNAPKTTNQIPPEYHELEPNEKIKKGDLVLTFGSDEWKESRNLGQTILPLSSKIYIRKLGV
jgi:hypothetical protein